MEAHFAFEFAFEFELGFRMRTHGSRPLHVAITLVIPLSEWNAHHTNFELVVGGVIQ